MEKYIRLNTAIIPSREVTKLAIRLSRNLSKDLKTEFTLDEKIYNPHITCYTVEYPLKNLERIKREVEKITRNFEVFKIKFKGLKITKEGNAYGVEIAIDKSSGEDNLHREIIRRLNPLREGHLREKYKDPEYVSKFPEGKRELMKKIMFKVGYARVLDVYRPHISITLFDRSVRRSDIKLPRLDIETMRVENIGIFSMGEWGTCKKLIKRYKLVKV